MSTDKIIEVMARAIDENSHPVNAARAALTALQSSGYMVIEGWRPIRTAVQSCEPRLLYDGDYQMVGNYALTFRENGPWEGWYSNGEWCDPQPTNFMPLPPPPQAQGEIEERSDTDGAEQLGSSLTQNKSGT
jgi:hypothetical protein